MIGPNATALEKSLCKGSNAELYPPGFGVSGHGNERSRGDYQLLMGLNQPEFGQNRVMITWIDRGICIPYDFTANGMHAP